MNINVARSSVEMRQQMAISGNCPNNGGTTFRYDPLCAPNVPSATPTAAPANQWPSMAHTSDDTAGDLCRITSSSLCNTINNNASSRDAKPRARQTTTACCPSISFIITVVMLILAAQCWPINCQNRNVRKRLGAREVMPSAVVTGSSTTTTQR